MANKNFDHVSHIKSRLPREIEEGEFYGLTPTTDNSEAEDSSPIKLNLAKRPTAENLIEGEIAVNYLKGHETLTIKNTEDEIVAFVNENDFNEAQEIVALGLAQEKNERVSDIARLESKISEEIGDKLDGLEDEVDERFADLDENIERLELGISSSLNDLNSRVNAMGDISGDMIDELESKFNTDIENINETITDMELVISASLNDLNSRIIDNEEVIQELGETMGELADQIEGEVGEQLDQVNQRIDDIELAVSASLNDLNSRIIETDGKFAEIENTFNEFDEGIEHIEHTISASLNDLNTRIIETNGTVDNDVQELRERDNELAQRYSFNGWEYVDLGLPSGTLWATCNLGAGSPTEFGLYYAWGETEGNLVNHTYNKTYTWDNYKYGRVVNSNNVAYKYNATDNKTSLDRYDDAVSMTMGGDWHMPTTEQIEELLTITHEWVSDYNGSGVEGYHFYANGQHLFLPAAGQLNDTGITASTELSNGFYWTKDVDTATTAVSLSITSSGGTHSITKSTFDKAIGVSVRGVIG